MNETQKENNKKLTTNIHDNAKRIEENRRGLDAVREMATNNTLLSAAGREELGKIDRANNFEDLMAKMAPKLEQNIAARFASMAAKSTEDQVKQKMEEVKESFKSSINQDKTTIESLKSDINAIKEDVKELKQRKENAIDSYKQIQQDIAKEENAKIEKMMKNTGCTAALIQNNTCINKDKQPNSIGFTGWLIVNDNGTIDCKFIGNQSHDEMLDKLAIAHGKVGTLNPPNNFVNDLFDFTFAQHGRDFKNSFQSPIDELDVEAKLAVNNFLNMCVNNDGQLSITSKQIDEYIINHKEKDAIINEIHYQMSNDDIKANRFVNSDAGRLAFKLFRLQPLSALIIENSALTYENLFTDPATKKRLENHNNNVPLDQKINIDGITSYDYKDFKHTKLWKEVLLKPHTEKTLQRKDGKIDKELLEGDMLIYVGQTYNPVSAHTVGLGEHDKNCWYSTAHRTVFSDDGWYQKISAKDGGKTAFLGGGGGKYFYANHQNIEIGYGWTWASQGSQAFGGKKSNKKTKKRRRQRTLKQKKNRKSKKKYSKKKKSKK